MVIGSAEIISAMATLVVSFDDWFCSHYSMLRFVLSYPLNFPRDTEDFIMSVERNKEAIRRLINIFNAHDFSRMDEVCDENVVYRTASGIELRGVEAYRDVMTQLHEAFPDFEYSLLDIVGEGDRIHWTYRYTGTHRGEFMGIQASDKKADYIVASACRFDDGKLVDELDFYDGLTFMRQLGVLSEEVKPGGEDWPTGGKVLRPQ